MGPRRTVLPDGIRLFLLRHRVAAAIAFAGVLAFAAGIAGFAATLTFAVVRTLAGVLTFVGHLDDGAASVGAGFGGS